MNNYKFRGKQCWLDDDGKKVFGKWVYGYLMDADKICPPNIDLTAPDFFDLIDFVAPETVGQWTGLKDKNGKEIYADDVLQADGIKLLVCFGENNFNSKNTFGSVGFYLKRIGSKYGDTMSFSKEPYYEVIGNIHDNPELLEGAEK